MTDETPTAPNPAPAKTTPAKAAARKGRPPAAAEVLGALAAEKPVPEKKPRAAAEKKPRAVAEKKPARVKAIKPEEPRSKPLNFRVAPEFRKAFRRAAAAQDCKKVELLEKIFAEWSERNPG